jgi:hypothetical protein
MDGVVTVGPGQQIRTMDLVNKLRAYRGRLSRRELCAALGYGADNQRAYKVICRLCVDYQIATAPRPGPPPRPNRPSAKVAIAMLAEARRQLAAEIEAHQDRLRDGRSPPYKPGPLGW